VAESGSRPEIHPQTRRIVYGSVIVPKPAKRRRAAARRIKGLPLIYFTKATIRDGFFC